MRTTLVIDDNLYRRVKAKAALEGRKLTELIEEGLRAVLESDHARQPQLEKSRRRVRLPLIPAASGDLTIFAGMSQEEIHQRLADLQSEADRADDAVSL